MSDSPPPLSKYQHYRKEDWDGHDLYQCNDCPWDTLDDEGLMEQHQAAAHGREAVNRER